jgi:IclR family acetate operon transcriptional repressor
MSMPSERANERRGVMPARPPMGRDHGGIQALDRAFSTSWRMPAAKRS